MNQKKREDLQYVATVPSVDLLGFIAIKDLMVLGSSDERYQYLKEQNPVLKQYLESFTTSFGTKVNPSIIVRDKSLPKVDATHLCAFRNAIAIAAVIGSRALSCIQNQTAGFYCTDIFDFHPVSVSSDGTDLIGGTPFEMSMCCGVDDFSGQTTPAVIYPQNIHPVYDKELMLALSDLVEKKVHKLNDKSFKNRVIRSMEMVYKAMRSPFEGLGEPVDFGVQMSQWVSAFETLANPHNRDVKFSDVSTMIKLVPWRNRKLRIKNRTPVDYKCRNKTTLPVQIYGRLWRTRNAYMHGNSMRKGEYEYHQRKGWGKLFFQAPALYRCVLMNLLNSRDFGRLLADAQEHDLYERVLLSKGNK
jgi:hypothetical protein